MGGVILTCLTLSNRDTVFSLESTTPRAENIRRAKSRKAMCDGIGVEFELAKTWTWLECRTVVFTNQWR